MVVLDLKGCLLKNVLVGGEFFLGRGGGLLLRGGGGASACSPEMTCLVSVFT